MLSVFAMSLSFSHICVTVSSPSKRRSMRLQSRISAGVSNIFLYIQGFSLIWMKSSGLVLSWVWSIWPAWIRLVYIEDGTWVVIHPSASRSRIRRAWDGYSLNCQLPLRSNNSFGISDLSISLKQSIVSVFGVLVNIYLQGPILNAL